MAKYIPEMIAAENRNSCFLLLNKLHIPISDYISFPIFRNFIISLLFFILL